jgi:hypothetical protein
VSGFLSVVSDSSGIHAFHTLNATALSCHQVSCNSYLQFLLICDCEWHIVSRHFLPKVG